MSLKMYPPMQRPKNPPPTIFFDPPRPRFDAHVHDRGAPTQLVMLQVGFGCVTDGSDSCEQVLVASRTNMLDDTVVTCPSDGSQPAFDGILYAYSCKRTITKVHPQN